MIEAVFKGVEPDAEKRSCFDCRSCKAAASWWCTNEEAKKARGTSLPGVIKCSFWTPARKWEDLSLFERWFGDYVVYGPGDVKEDGD